MCQFLAKRNKRILSELTVLIGGFKEVQTVQL